MPHEIWPKNGKFLLTADKVAYQQEVHQHCSRNNEQALGPIRHYLWRRHPVIEWLQDRMLTNTGRHEALVLGLNSGIKPGESIFLVSALIPNRKANPVIWSWYAVYCKDRAVTRIAPLSELLEHLALGKRSRPNTGRPVDLKWLESLRQPVVAAVKSAVIAERDDFNAKTEPLLAEQLLELEGAAPSSARTSGRNAVTLQTTATF